jgi:hypothetical protein
MTDTEALWKGPTETPTERQAATIANLQAQLALAEDAQFHTMAALARAKGLLGLVVRAVADGKMIVVDGTFLPTINKINEETK